MNFFNFLVTRQLVVNKTGDTQRANQLGMLTSFIPGTWGMMMGMMLADREEAPKPVVGGNNNEPKSEPVTVSRGAGPSAPSSSSPTAR